MKEKTKDNETEVKEPTLVLPDDFSPEDLKQDGYTRPLAEAAALIAEQNRALIARTKCRDFRPEDELLYVSNGAHTLIHDLFESVASYAEGRVPGAVLSDMVATTQSLLSALDALPRAPHVALDESRVAFLKAKILWARIYPKPRCSRKAYLKKVFALEKGIFDALDKLHAAYRNAELKRKPRRRRVPKAELDSVQLKRREDRERVFRAIKDLQDRKGLSVLKAIAALRRLGSYGANLGRLPDETWRTYYERWRRSCGA